jgi:hypothetical protein
MFGSAWREVLARMQMSKRATRNSVRRQDSRRRRPIVEQLEDRVVPTILFTPQYGPENAVDNGGQKLESPQILVMFWGSYWQDGANPLVNDLINATQTLFPMSGPSTYLSGLTQQAYGMDGTANYANAVFHDSDPPNSFSNDDITNAFEYEIDHANSYFPDSYNTSHGKDPLYVIFTPPGIRSNDPKEAGYNSWTGRGEANVLHPFDFYEYAWAGAKNLDPNTATDPANIQTTIDTYTKILSHEVVEAMSDPYEGRLFNKGGIRVTPGPNFQNPPPKSSQLCDYEAQSYTYRLGGVLVQSYWSQGDQKFMVPDGNQQTFVVDNGTLNVNGDQLGQPYNDFIIISQTAPNQNGQTGVFVYENAETVAFEPGAINAIKVNTGDGNNTVFVISTLDSVPVTIQLGGGQDNVYVTPINGLGDIQGAVTVNGGFGTSTLTVDDSGNSNAANWTINDALIGEDGSAGVDYNNIQNVVINGGGGQTMFDVQNTNGATSTTINTGDADSDQVLVQYAPGPLTINDGAGAGDRTIVSQTPLNLDTVPGGVTVHGQGNSDSLFVDDQNNPNQSKWLVSGNSIIRSYFPQGGISGTAPPVTIEVDYSGIHQLTMYGGSGGADFHLSYLLGSLDELPADTIVYGHGGLAVTTLTAEDDTNSVGSLWKVTDQVVTRTYSSPAAGTHTATIEYHNIQTLTLNGGSGANTYDVLSTGLPTSTNLNTGAGTDVINVGGDNPRVLDPILGPLTVTAEGPSDTLNLNDQDTNFLTPRTFTLTATSVTRDNIALISYTGVASVVVNGGSGNDIFNVTGISHKSPITIYGGSGNDTVNLNNPDLTDKPSDIHQLTFYGQGGTNTLNLNDQASAASGDFILGANSLTNENSPVLVLDFDTTLTSLNVNAGSGDDTFEILHIPPTTAVAINGGGGTNTLNYGAFTGDVTVDLPLGIATGLSRGVSNIQKVYGSFGNDLLVGDANTKLLSGGALRNIIITGAGAAQAFGGGGDNILIAGTTDYDKKLAALDDFMIEWLRTDLSFHQRFADIETAGASVPSNLPASALKGTGFKLNPSTVHANQSINILMGGNGSGNDWFFWDPSEDVLLNKKKGDAFTVVH